MAHVVLIVEDDKNVAEFLRRVLELQSYVVEAVFSIEGLKVLLGDLEKNGESILFAFVDGKLHEGAPENGDQEGIYASALIEEFFPEVLIIAISGQEHVGYGHLRVRKPISVEALIQVLKVALAVKENL